MKIAIDIRCLMHKNYSGVAEYTYNLLDNLFKIDRQNQYILFYNSKKNITANLPQFPYSNVKFKGFTYPNKLFNFSVRFLHWPQIDKMLGGVDIFFIPNFNFLSLSSNCKKILTVHDLSFEIYPNFFSLKRKLWHRIIAPRKIIRQADSLIADSQSTKNDLIELYQVAAGKIKIIHLGVDRLLYKKIEPSNLNLKLIKDKYKLPDQFILYLGTIEPRKNIESIIESFNLLKIDSSFQDLNLVIAGEAGWRCKQVFEMASKSKYKDQIKFIGYVKKSDKPYLYNLTETFLFPSFYEGFGLPILEAQACGTPVITSTNSSLPEITADSAFLINPDNLTEIKNAIRQILTNQELKNDLINKGLENSAKFTWQKCAQETLQLFNI